MLFAGLALVTTCVPVIAIAELPRMRRRTLLIYALLSSWMKSSVRVWPSGRLALCVALGLFIVNQLLEHRERALALFSEYAQHFEDSWMRGFQLVISLIFSPSLISSRSAGSGS